MINAWAFVNIKGANVEKARRILRNALDGAKSYSDVTGSYYRGTPSHAIPLKDLAQAVKDYEALRAAEVIFLERLKK